MTNVRVLSAIRGSDGAARGLSGRNGTRRVRVAIALALAVAGGSLFATSVHGRHAGPAASKSGEREDGRLPGSQRDATSDAYVCTDGPRVELFYMHPYDVPDRYGWAQNDIREFFYWAANRLNERALELSGKRVSIPTACVDGYPLVQKVESDFAADAIPGRVSSDTALRNEMIEKGLTDTNVKYWFWRDNPNGTGGGRAGMIPMCNKAKGAGGTGDCDDRPTADNWFNRGGSDFYANTWGGDGSGGTMLHEAFHLWGAVQYSAPNSSGGGHCTDEADLMCYSDAPAHPPMRSVCTNVSVALVDCNGDDYFHPSPETGTYLASRWNPASCANYFLRVEGCEYPFHDPPQPPKGPPFMRDLYVSRSLLRVDARISWSPVPGATSYRVYESRRLVALGEPAASAPLTTTTAEAYTADQLDPAYTYCWSVAAVNDRGEGPRSPDECAT